MCPAAALAQRVEENATTASADAFGHSVGTEKSGLYSVDETRGFSPVDAGNVRIRGLYFDLIDRLPGRLAQSSTVRVGLSAQSFAFPAPTGLVDYELHQPGTQAQLSIDLDNGNSFNSRSAAIAVMGRLPLADGRLGLLASGTLRRNTRVEGGTSNFRAWSLAASWHPGGGAEIFVFNGAVLGSSDEARATYYPAGTAPPPEVPRGKFLGLDWTQRNPNNSNSGVMAHVPLGPGWTLDSGLFLSAKSWGKQFSDLLLGVTPDGMTSMRTVIADGKVLDRSFSGEMRLTRTWASGAFAQRLAASVRGRIKDRRFGGSQTLLLGAGSIYDTTGWAQPAYTLGVKDQDHVRQLTAGLSWNIVWRGKASLDLGLSKSFYRKHVDFANPALADPVTRDRPWVWNVSGSYAFSPVVSVYGGYARGLEEALIAPDIATNRSEAPSAVHTSQVEGGLRFALTRHLTLSGGAFSISKPYFNLDPALRYRKLGSLTNRGVEVSVTGQILPGVTMVGGAMFLDPKIAGEAVDTHLIGPRPVGQVRSHSALNVDWRLAGGKSPLSLDVSVENYSARIANSANTLSAPARTQVNIGAHYRFDLGKAKLVVRPLIFNLFNSYGWNVSSSGGWTFNSARTFNISIAADL